MSKVETITRNIIKVRSGREMTYPFTTYPAIFKGTNIISRYLAKVFTEGIPQRPTSASEQKPWILPVQEITHEMTDYAKKADYRRGMNYQHEYVQKYLLENDPHTIAIEVPVYDEEKTGFIDILRLVGVNIEIWDFKPNAHKEDKNKVASQLLRYKQMLTERIYVDFNTKIDNVLLYYFDDSKAYHVTSQNL